MHKMARKDDLKLLFNFMIELLKDEQENETVSFSEKNETPFVTPKEFNDINKRLSEKQDESAKHILEVMKRVDILDRMRRTVPVVPTNQRDTEEQASLDREIVKTHEAEKGGRSLESLRNTLKDAKNFMTDLDTKKPLVPSVPLHELNELETKRVDAKIEEIKNFGLSNVKEQVKATRKPKK